MSILTAKFEIKPIAENEEQLNNIYKELRQMSFNCFKMANEGINILHFNNLFENRIVDIDYGDRRNKIIKKINSLKEKLKKDSDNKELKEKLKKENTKLNLCYKEAREKAEIFYCESKQNTIYSYYTDKYSFIPSYIRSALSKKINEDYKNDLKEIKAGKRSIRNYKKGMAVPFMASMINNIYYENNKCFIILLKYKFNIVSLNKDNNNKAVINYILEKGKNKKFVVLGDSFFKFEKNKLFLFLSVKYSKKKRQLNKNIIVGIDTGCNILAYCALNKGEDRLYLGSGKDIGKYIKGINERKKRCENVINKGGKGRKKKLKSLYRIRNKKSNYVNTYNHLVSKKVIDFCIKNNAGTIHLEYLKGFNKKKFLNERWPYYRLQQYIIYKAEKEGIEVKYICAAYTSQTCSCCGNIDKNQRDKQKFICSNKKCKMYGKKVNADYNAAINIARSEKYIENEKDYVFYKQLSKDNSGISMSAG